MTEAGAGGRRPARRVADAASGRRLEGRVLRARSGFFDVLTAEGQLRCTLRGRLKQAPKGSDICVVGDRVEILWARAGKGTVERVLPRQTQIARRKPGSGEGRRQDVLVANPDRLCAVFAYGRPAPRWRLLDRFLVAAERGGVEGVIVANKLDLATEEDRGRFRAYERLGYRLIESCALDEAGLASAPEAARGLEGIGVQQLAELLGDGVSVLAGPSGVGKSSLLNSIEPGLGLKVGALAEASGKGTHTTRVATLIPLARGGFVADTPGVREFGIDGLDPVELVSCFPELRTHQGGCGYRSCRHESEPHCAVKDALARGEVGPERYDSYLRLLRGDDVW